MRIAGSIPLHVARAYGLPRPAAAPAPAPNARPDTTPPARVDGLVAARTTTPIHFDGTSTPPPTAAALPLYNRAADRVEAAVAVQVGRQIDVRG